MRSQTTNEGAKPFMKIIQLTKKEQEILEAQIFHYSEAKKTFAEASRVLNNFCILLAGEEYKLDLSEGVKLFDASAVDTSSSED